MLKPMKPKQTFPKNMILWILVGVLILAGIIVLITAFSGSDSNSADEVNAVYTNAAATVAVQQMTLQASTPSVTPTTFTQTPAATFTPLASPTLFTSPVLATNTVSAPSGAVGCNNSAYVSDVTIPDDTVVTPGQTFTKTWKLQNTGSCPWTTSYKVSFVSGNAMGGTTTALTVTVQPGQSGDISVALTAPAAAGDAIGYWILTNDSGQNFGTSFYVKVKVGGTGTSGTVTATATGGVAPAAANNPTITLTSCALENGVGPKYEYSGTLNWEDKSNNETGFNIYINGILVTTVSANVTKYDMPKGVFFDSNTPSFIVEAVNGSLKAAQATVSGTCP